MRKKLGSLFHFRLRLHHLAWLGLAALIVYQAWLYYYRLPLSLGPLVIFFPWMIQKGYVPYENLIDIHPPFMFWFLAVLGSIIPNGLRVARLTIVGLLTFSTLLTFLIACRQSGRWAGLAAAALFVLVAPMFGWSKLYTEGFLAAAYLVYLLCYKPSDHSRSYKWWIFWGLFGGVLVLIKQHSTPVFAAFLIWEGITAWVTKRSKLSILRDLVFTGLFSFIPLALALIFQTIQVGSPAGMIYWLLQYPFIGHSGFEKTLPTLTQVKFLFQVNFLLLPAFIGMGILIRGKDPAWKQIGLWFAILLTSSLTIYPRYSTWHLQPIMPVIILLSVWIAGAALRAEQGKLARAFIIGATMMLAGYWTLNYLPHQIDSIRSTEKRLISEYTYPQELAEQIRQIAGQPESIYIFPDDEAITNLYYFLGCMPPRYWTYHYPWNMMDDVKANILVALEESPPEWVVYLPDRWLVDVHAPELVEYVESHYRLEANLSFDNKQVQLLRRIPGR